MNDDGYRSGDLRQLLDEVEREHGDKSREAMARAWGVPERDLAVLGGPTLGRRLRWDLRRRLTTDGQIGAGMLRRALAIKEERFSGTDDGDTGPAASGCNWHSVGPRNINGRIKQLVIHPTNGQILYAGAANGGVWKTTDAGQSWSPTMHDELSLAIGALALDPNAPETVYAGTGEPVHYGTAAAPPLTNVSWFYEGVGVYKTTDGGGTWSLTGAMPNDFVYALAVDPFDGQNVLCAGYSLTGGAGGLCRSVDGGASWSVVSSGVFTDVLFDPTNAGVAYAGQNNGGVLKSTDSGGTWSPRNTGLPATGSIGRVCLSLARANANVLYALLENDGSGGLLGLYRTASAAEAPGGWAATVAPPASINFAWWCAHVHADPADAAGNIVWVGGVNVVRSADGGTSWTLVSDAYNGTRPPTHSDQHDLVMDPANSNIVYIANDGGVFRGVWSGGAPPVAWTKVSTGLVVSQFYDLSYSPASPSVFGGGAQDNGTAVSTGGLSWRHVRGGDGGYVAFHPTDPYTFYVQSQGAAIQRTTDGGNTFTSASSGIAGGGTFPATVFVIDPTNPLILFAGTSSVYRSINGGVGAGAWTAASGVLGLVSDIAIAPSSSAVVYAGTVGGQLHRATDGGITATSFANITPSGTPARWLAGVTVHPANANVVYLTFLGFNGSGSTSDHVWKGTFDPVGSTWTWQLRAGGLPDVPVGALAIHPTTLELYIATDVGVFRSVDDGVSWTTFEAGLPNTAIVDLALDPVRNTLRAATHGRGMYQRRLSGTCPDVDIYLRDNILDTGETFPSPSGVPDPTQPGAYVYFYNSADIKVDAPPFDPTDALIDGVEFDDPEHPYTGSGGKIEDIAGITHDAPIRTQVNRVYVQVHNRGWQKADSVTLKVLWADAGAGLPALPADFWPAFPGDGFTQTQWKPVGTATITDLLPVVPRVASFNWTPPGSTSNHVCLLAMIDSPQDPLLPQTETNVDVLTPFNKRITHRNLHPINPTAPTGGPAERSWILARLNNAADEARFFDLRIEHIRHAGGNLRVIFPDPPLKLPLQDSTVNARAGRISSDDLVKLVRAGAGKDAGSVSAAKELSEVSGSSELLMLDIGSARDAAELRGILLEPHQSMPCLICVGLPERRRRLDPLRFYLNQYCEDRLVGGSEYVLQPPRMPSSPWRKPGYLRIVLHEIEVLDDHDPWIFGRGELCFFVDVIVEGEGTRRVRRRLPSAGILKAGDMPPDGRLRLDDEVFAGIVAPGERLTLSVLPVEMDWLTPDDPFVRYRRTFRGNSADWLGDYGPGDEPDDPEALSDWRLWYSITEGDDGN